jgi:two-component system sensor histidine kinase TctE
MFWKQTPRLSLSGNVLAVLLPGLLTIIGAELWLTRLDAIDAANAAFDRSLLGAVKSVELNTSTASGGVSVELPYRLFEFFQLTAHGTVYFRVATADGLVEIGTPDLPQPEERPQPGVPVFHDGRYLGTDVRVGTYIRNLERPLASSGIQQLVIQVAETVETRRTFIRSFVLRTAARDALVISLIGLGLAVLLTLLLRPVSRLAAQVTSRQPSDLRPLEARDLPRDVQPLVDAVNQQLARTRELMERQRQFVDDASHQLRTPLATLHAQVGYALREGSREGIVAALASIARQLEHATRSTNQLLALARTDAIAPNPERFELGELLREVGTQLLPLARAKHLDFGIERPPMPCECLGERQLLMEALSNLAHNAITYTDEGGDVTLQAECDAQGHSLKVLNSGAAVPVRVMEELGQRFVKGHGHSGAGLGLAIAKSIIERHRGVLTLERDEALGRNCARLWWPRAEAAPS